MLVAAGVVASFGLGWAGGLNWPQFASELGLVEVAQQETPAPRISEARSSGKMEGARKTASAANSPAIVGSIPKPSTLLPGAARPATSPAAAIAMRQPLVAAPETRPATIPGWTVVDVRDGTAVLEGPDGIRMAARGDTIPGAGTRGVHRALGQPLGHCHRRRIDCDAVTALPNWWTVISRSRLQAFGHEQAKRVRRVGSERRTVLIARRAIESDGFGLFYARLQTDTIDVPLAGRIFQRFE